MTEYEFDIKIPDECVGSCEEGEDGYYTVTLSAENILDLPRETAIKVVEYILSQWHDCNETLQNLIGDNEESDYPEDANLEVGFDPYLGCYTDDC